MKKTDQPEMSASKAIDGSRQFEVFSQPEDKSSDGQE